MDPLCSHLQQMNGKMIGERGVGGGGRGDGRRERERELYIIDTLSKCNVLMLFSDTGFMSLCGTALTQTTRLGSFLELSSSPNSVSFQINSTTMLMTYTNFNFLVLIIIFM